MTLTLSSSKQVFLTLPLLLKVERSNYLVERASYFVERTDHALEQNDFERNDLNPIHGIYKRFSYPKTALCSEILALFNHDYSLLQGAFTTLMGNKI